MAPWRPAFRRHDVKGVLNNPFFVRLWIAYLVSNSGTYIQSVGAAWLMLILSGSHQMVALVHAAATIPIMLFSIPAGYVADRFDRKSVLIFAQLIMMSTTGLLSILVLCDLITPALLLVFTFVLGSGMAFHSPIWNASFGDWVSQKDLPAAITLQSLGNNLTRCLAPGLGGVIVSFAGAALAFATNAMTFLAVVAALMKWPERVSETGQGARQFHKAVLGGFKFCIETRYVSHLLLRSFLFGIGSSGLLSLLPSVVRDQWQGSSFTYGIGLCMFGVGAIGGALSNQSLRSQISGESVVRIASCGFIICNVATALTTSLGTAALGLVIGGTCWVWALTYFNINVQMSSPRTLVGRVVSIYHLVLFGGLGIGSWIWSTVVLHEDLPTTLLISCSAFAFIVCFGLIRPVPRSILTDTEIDKPKTTAAALRS